MLVRIDGASDILPVVPYCGLLLLGRRRQALPLIGGVAVGAAYGIIDGLVFSRPYLATNKSSLVPLALAAPSWSSRRWWRCRCCGTGTCQR